MGSPKRTNALVHLSLIFVVFLNADINNGEHTMPRILGASAAIELQSVEYRFTVRDFMWAGCLNSSTIGTVWPATKTAQSGFAHRSYEETMDETNYKANCPLWQDILQHRVSAHPDFEIDRRYQAMGTSGIGKAFQTDVVSDPIWHCNLTDIVRPRLMVDSDGLSKPQFLSRGECTNEASSQFNKSSTAGAEYFGKWYRDDSKVNKRVGFVLPLNRTISTNENTLPIFVFDSGEEGFFPLTNRAPCSAINGTEDCSNGGEVWPWSNIETELENKFGFTSEHHSHFLYRGGETFSFSGDDDLWVFINGQLAVDLGGTHPRYETTINLDNVREYLNIVANNTYSVDIFHAERHTIQSNFKITTSLQQQCNVQTSASRTIDLAPALSSLTARGDFVWNGLYSRKNPPTSGRFSQENTGDFTLINAGDNYASAHLFYKYDINIGPGLIAEVDFKVSSSGLDSGFAFVLHRRPAGIDDISGGGVSGFLGFRYFERAVAVALDFCNDRQVGTTSSVPVTCSKHRLALHYNRDEPDKKLSAMDPKSVQLSANLATNLADGRTHRVRVVVLEEPTWLEVYVDDSLYMVDKSFNITERLGGGRDGFVGITGASGLDAKAISILGFRADSVRPDPMSTVVEEEEEEEEQQNAYDEVLVADDESAVTFRIRSRDVCGNSIENGGLVGSVVGLLVRSQTYEAGGSRRLQTNANTSDALLYAQSVDNGDGSYNVRFSAGKGREGPYDLILAFGNCYIDVNSTSLDGLVTTPPEQPSVESTECWRTTKLNAVNIKELVIAPTRHPTPIPTQSGNVLADVPAIWVGSMAGLLLLLILLLLCCCFAVRRRWRKRQGVLALGRKHVDDDDVEYIGENELRDLNHRVWGTRARLLQMRARKSEIRRREAEELRRRLEKEAIHVQTAEIQDHLRSIKKRNQQQNEQTGRKHVHPKHVLRKQFTPFGADDGSGKGGDMNALGMYQPRLGSFASTHSPGANSRTTDSQSFSSGDSNRSPRPVLFSPVAHKKQSALKPLKRSAKDRHRDRLQDDHEMEPEPSFTVVVGEPRSAPEKSFASSRQRRKGTPEAPTPIVVSDTAAPSVGSDVICDRNGSFRGSNGSIDNASDQDGNRDSAGSFSVEELASEEEEEQEQEYGDDYSDEEEEEFSDEYGDDYDDDRDSSETDSHRSRTDRRRGGSA